MKPLVFLHPLSERLTALKESVEETAEAENIEIFDIESIDEFRELAPHLGQFLVLCSNPKLCSRMLQQNTRILKKEQSKVILLSSKQFPRKIVDRLNKLGLTDLILDNVAAKTLQYKVKLQLRSIVVKKEENDEVLIKHEDEINKEEESSKVDESKVQEEEEDLYGRKAKKDKKEEEQKPKEYPGKASLLLEDDLNPDTVISHASDESEVEDEKIEKKKTIADLEKKAQEKKKNLPWHKAKEDGKQKGSSVTDKIDNVWSSQSNKGPNLKEKESEDLEGEGSTDSLEKERKGEIAEQEAAIETHWEGEVKDAPKEDHGAEEESFYSENIKKHYEGETEGSEELKEDFDTAQSEFKEADKDDMVGVSEVDKKQDRLQGDTVKELIQQDDLQTDSDGTDELEGEMQSSGENTKAKEASLLKADFEGRNQINDELNASLEEDRNHTNKDSMGLTPNLNKWDEEDLAADSKTDKSQVDPLAADSKMDKLGENLSSDSTGTEKKKAELLQSRGIARSEEELEKENQKKNALLDKIKENRKKNAPKKIDGHMRSPSAKKQAQKEEELPTIDPQTPIQKKQKEEEEKKPGEFASDEFENNAGEANTDNQNNDDMFGEGTPEQALEDMDGDSNVDHLGEDLLEGEAKAEEAKGDTYDNFGKQAILEVEDDEEAKKKKRLQELYDLKKEKLAELAEKERKRKEALASEEDLYKKDRDWDEKTLDMESTKNQNEVEMGSEEKYAKSGQENLEAIVHEKSDHYDEEVLEARRRHEKEEITLDPEDLSDIERELLQSVKDWGEQTIDYRKIKAGEEGISVSRIGSDSASEISIREKEIEKEQKIYNGTVLDGDLDEEEIIEEEGEEVIHPDSKGIESIIQILNSYFTKDIMPSDVLSQTCTLVNKERGFGVASFFYRTHGSDEFNEILSGHESLSSQDKLTWWNNFKQEMLSSWTSSNLPYWSDKTFQDDHIHFYYPYYEGTDHLGFAIVTYNNGMKEENAARIEVTLEAARAVYLSQRHKENGEAAIYNELKEAPPEEITPFTLGEEAQPEASHEPERRYMDSGDNLILLEKRRALKEEEEKQKAEKSKKGNIVKNLWNRMFG